MTVWGWDHGVGMTVWGWDDGLGVGSRSRVGFTVWGWDDGVGAEITVLAGAGGAMSRPAGSVTGLYAPVHPYC
jgi:hypothetical protein